MENVASTFSPRDRIDRLTMGNLDIAGMREKLRIYSQLGQRDAPPNPRASRKLLTRHVPAKTARLRPAQEMKSGIKT